MESNAILFLGILTSAASEVLDVSVMYAEIIKELRKLILIEDIVYARGTSTEVSDSKILDDVEEVIEERDVYKDRLYPIEVEEW